MCSTYSLLQSNSIHKFFVNYRSSYYSTLAVQDKYWLFYTKFDNESYILICNTTLFFDSIKVARSCYYCI